jgi:hypothetical protein
METNAEIYPKADWLSQLPSSDIRSSFETPSEARNPAIALVKYSEHWNGSYKTDESVVMLKPKIISGITVAEDGKYYDSSISGIINDKIELKQGGGYTEITEMIPNVFDQIEIESEEKLMFRGVGSEAMKQIKNKGVIDSGINLHSSGQDHKEVFYASRFDIAASYAAHGACFYDMATFDKPTFVFATPRPENAFSNTENEIIVRENVDLAKVRIFEIIPYILSEGNVPITQIKDNGGEIHLETPDIYTVSVNAPRGRFAFKEVSLDEIIL